jgi:GNAT superfamily N-acetyltransferase
MGQMTDAIAISRYLDLDATPERMGEIDAIFFESSNTKSFKSEAAKEAFRERWLGRYLRRDPQFAYLASRSDGAVVGYLVGAVDDPAKGARFADIGYFASLSAYTERFPAHLHVNVAAGFRSQGIGRRLIERFAEDAKAAGAPGVHVVTSAGAANVAFYRRNGFAEVARAGENGDLVFLGRLL